MAQQFTLLEQHASVLFRAGLKAQRGKNATHSEVLGVYSHAYPSAISAFHAADDALFSPRDTPLRIADLSRDFICVLVRPAQLEPAHELGTCQVGAAESESGEEAGGEEASWHANPEKNRGRLQ